MEGDSAQGAARHQREVPGDISSAAFLLVAAAIVRDGRVTLHRVGVNPTRTGLLDVLEAMGARVQLTEAARDGEPMASLTVSSTALASTTVGGAVIPRLIDEVPVLAVAAALATAIPDRDAAECA